MNTRRTVLLAGGVGLLHVWRLGHGQVAATIRRVGLLTLGSEAAGAHLRAAYREGMHELGWVEGKNVEYRVAYADGAVDRMDVLVGDLIGQRRQPLQFPVALGGIRLQLKRSHKNHEFYRHLKELRKPY